MNYNQFLQSECNFDLIRLACNVQYLKDYNNFADALSEGFVEAEKILQEERVFSNKDLPYSTQLIPLAALCTLLSNGNRIKVTNIKNKIRAIKNIYDLNPINAPKNTPTIIVKLFDKMPIINPIIKIKYFSFCVEAVKNLK